MAAPKFYSITAMPSVGGRDSNGIYFLRTPTGYTLHRVDETVNKNVVDLKIDWSNLEGKPTTVSGFGITDAFKMGGNAFGAIAYFGTTDANSLIFRTNNANRGAINGTTGNFLWGTTADNGLDKLQVTGGISGTTTLNFGQDFFSTGYSNFGNGVYVETDIPNTQTRKTELTITGYPYAGANPLPINTAVNCYTSSTTVINNLRGADWGQPINTVDAFYNAGGFLCFWFTTPSSSTSFRLRLGTQSGNHRITSVTNVVRPTGTTADVTINCQSFALASSIGNGTLTLNTSGIATGSASFTANQSGNSTFTVNVPATNLSVSATAGEIVSSTGTNAVLQSLGRLTVADAYTSLPTNGLWHTFNTTGSINFPNSLGSGLLNTRAISNATGAFWIWKNSANDGVLYYNVGTGSSAWSGWKIFADRDWVTNQNYIGLNSLSGTAPITYNTGTGAIGITQATSSTNGYLSSTDWNTFNNKQAALVSGTNIKTVNGITLLGAGNLSVGTVSSVGLTVPTGLTVTSGSPVTGAGTIVVGLQSGYSIPTTANQTNWGTAYTYSQVGHLPLAGGNVTGNTAIGGTAAVNQSLLVRPLAANRRALVLQGFSGQSVNLQEWQNNGSAVMSFVNSAGQVDFNTSTYSTGGYDVLVKNQTSGLHEKVAASTLLNNLADAATFSPSYSALSNISSAYTNNGFWSYIRIGNIIDVVGAIIYTATTSGAAASLEVSLPITGLADAYDLTGIGVTDRNPTNYAANITIGGNVANQTAHIVMHIEQAGIALLNVHFRYKI